MTPARTHARSHVRAHTCTLSYARRQAHIILYTTKRKTKQEQKTQLVTANTSPSFYLILSDFLDFFSWHHLIGIFHYSQRINRRMIHIVMLLSSFVPHHSCYRCIYSRKSFFQLSKFRDILFTLKMFTHASKLDLKSFIRRDCNTCFNLQS